MVNPTKRKIQHLDLLGRLQKSPVGDRRGLVEIYRNEVLTGKTRTIRLFGRKIQAQIINTLLGYELKASNKRIHCPDLVTARYLKLFTEIGCRSIKIPYDPTLTARVIPELEACIDSLATGVQQLFPRPRKLQLYVIRELYSRLRRQIRRT